MATITKTASGRYTVQVKVGNGPGARRDSGTFDTKREAQDWFVQRRTELRAEAGRGAATHYTLRQAIQKYHDEVAPGHKGTRWEQIRCAMFQRDADLPLSLPIGRVTDEHIERWRDRRQMEVSGSSVRREMSLLGSIFTAAATDWKWIKTTPLKGVRRPPGGPGRDVVMTRPQIRGVLRALGYRRQRPTSMKQVVAHMLLLALRTGMRSGEMEGLTWDRVHAAYVSLPETKNGDARDVPLPRKARPIIERMRGWDDTMVFPITAQSRDSLWRTARKVAKLSGFTFHDSRHTAATWVGRQVGRPGRLSFPEFCRAFGWRNPAQALQYVNPTAAELAEKMS